MDNDETVSSQAASGEVLSEEEKDALMAGVNSGEVDNNATLQSGEAVPYDLTSQDRIVRGRLPVLEKINERFIRQMQGGFEKMLNRPVEVSVGGRNESAANIEHLCFMVHEKDRYQALKRILDFLWVNVFATGYDHVL